MHEKRYPFPGSQIVGKTRKKKAREKLPRSLEQASLLRGSSRVPAPRTSAELKDKFLSHCSQTSAGDHMQIIGDTIGVIEVKVLTSQTHTYTLCRV